LGWIAFVAVVLKGGTGFPKWLALVNPIVLVIISSFLTNLLRDSAKDLLDGAGINIGYFLPYVLSTLPIFSNGKLAYEQG